MPTAPAKNRGGAGRRVAPGHTRSALRPLGPGKVTLPKTEHNMQRHGINSVAVVVCSQRRSHDAGGASGLHVPAHAVKLDGKRSSRNAAAARAARPRTAHSTPAAGTAWPKNLPRNPHRAGPRAARALPRWARPGPALAAPAAARGNAGSGPAAAAGRAAWPDNAVPPASVATGGPLPDTPGCNRAAADGTAGRTAHIPSASRCAHSNGEVDPTCRMGDLGWAHGRSCSQRSSLGGELRTRRRGVFIGSVTSA